jgi:hypothetical protein
MPLILPGNVASATAAVGYDVANSCRFDGSSDDMTKTAGDGDVDKWTLSMWVKRAGLGATGYMFSAFADGANYSAVYFESADTLTFLNLAGGENAGRLKTTRIFRDISAWYHIVAVWDSDNATAGDRMKLYVNGVEETVFGTDENPDQDQNSSNTDGEETVLGQKGDDGAYFSGYLAEVVLLDGIAAAPTSFGEFSEDSPTIWQPIDVSGLTFGTNGFYCDFEASGNLGNDANGGTDFTETNLVAADQATDTPTNNFCTMNPHAQVDASGAASSFTFSEGNCTVVGGSPASYVGATMAPSAGKWYYEMKLSHGNTVINMWFGVRSYDESWGPSGYAEPEGDGTILDGWFWKWGNNGVNTSGASGSDGQIHHDKAGVYSTVDTGVALETDDIVGINLDLDNGDTYLQVNGSDVNSGNTVSDLRVDQGFFYTPIVNTENASVDTTVACSFGGCPAFALSSAVNDENGYGNFEYAPKSGYLAICSKNLGSDGG